MNTTGKYLGVYHPDLPRAPWWKYTQRGVYLIKAELQYPSKGFRKHGASDRQLTKLGIVADLVWQGLRSRHATAEWREYATGDGVFYGIIAIVDNEAPRIQPLVSIHPDYVLGVMEEYGLRTRPEPQDWFMSHISPDHRSLGSLVRTFKGEVTKHCKRLDIEMKWKPRYIDRLLRDEEAYAAALQFLEEVARGEDGVRRKWDAKMKGWG
ncbi:MAG: hypothetical protein ACFCUH_08515 [Flavobacteriales bacterium]